MPNGRRRFIRYVPASEDMTLLIPAAVILRKARTNTYIYTIIREESRKCFHRFGRHLTDDEKRTLYVLISADRRERLREIKYGKRLKREFVTRRRIDVNGD